MTKTTTFWQHPINHTQNKYSKHDSLILSIVSNGTRRVQHTIDKLSFPILYTSIINIRNIYLHNTYFIMSLCNP